MNNKAISAIIRIGSIITVTLTSFIVQPPVIDASENGGVHWKSIFTFIAGILSVILYDRFKNQQKKRPIAFWLVGLLVCLFIGYEILYYNNSVSCNIRGSAGAETHRCVISNGDVKPEIRPMLDYWIKQKGSDAMSFLLGSYSCSSIEVWELKELSIPYYGFIFLYFSMIIILILIVVSISDKVLTDES